MLSLHRYVDPERGCRLEIVAVSLTNVVWCSPWYQHEGDDECIRATELCRATLNDMESDCAKMRALLGD